jgi:hypothetical protein
MISYLLKEFSKADLNVIRRFQLFGKSIQERLVIGYGEPIQNFRLQFLGPWRSLGQLLHRHSWILLASL